jgi:hypothetical protein
MADFEEQAEEEQESESQNTRQKRERRSTAVASPDQYRDEKFMRWQSHYNSRTPKKKKKRTDRNDKNAKPESLQGILWNVILNIESKDGVESGRSKPCSADNSNQESSSHVCYSSFVRRKCKEYQPRKNQFEDLDILAETKVGSDGSLRAYFKNEADGLELDCRLSLTDRPPE